jgi:hypothetical protein
MYQDGRQIPVEVMQELMNAMPDIQLKKLLRLGRVRETVNTQDECAEPRDHQPIPALKPTPGN